MGNNTLGTTTHSQDGKYSLSTNTPSTRWETTHVVLHPIHKIGDAHQHPIHKMGNYTCSTTPHPHDGKCTLSTNTPSTSWETTHLVHTHCWLLVSWEEKTKQKHWLGSHFHAGTPPWTESTWLCATKLWRSQTHCGVLLAYIYPYYHWVQWFVQLVVACVVEMYCITERPVKIVVVCLIFCFEVGKVVL